jgi:hypothetical protein
MDGLPDDDDKLAALSGMGDVWMKGGSTTLPQFFEPHPRRAGCLTNPRLELERQRQDTWRNKSRQGGINSGASRRHNKPDGSQLALQPVTPDSNHRPTKDEPTPQPNGNTASATASTKEKENPALSSLSRSLEEEEKGNGEVITPSLQEVIEWGRIDGVTPEVCERFFKRGALLFIDLLMASRSS